MGIAKISEIEREDLPITKNIEEASKIIVNTFNKQNV